MKKTLYRFLPFGAFIGIALVFFMQLGKDASILPSPFINKQLPTFTASPLGTYPPLSSRDLLKNEVKILNVFASWCLPCKEEHPYINALNKIVPVYGLAWKDTQAGATNFLQNLGTPYRKILFDGTGRVGIDLGVYGVPETFVIDTTGAVRYRKAGAITENDFQETIVPLIRQLQAERNNRMKKAKQ